MMASQNRFLLVFIISLFSVLSFATTPHGSEEVEDEKPFSYAKETGNGPENWGRIDPRWHVCEDGKLQSPIDLLDDKRVLVSPKLGKLKRSYKPAPAVLKNRGHDVSVVWKGDAGKIVINGTAYKLLQCHWHTPSEHTLNDTRYKLEVHLVHNSSRGQLAVIAILYKLGRPDPFLAKLLHHTTNMHGDVDLGVVNPGEIKFGSRKYYRYIGSLTIPPCTEGVIWTIVMKVRTVSREQIRRIRDTVHDGFKENARPIQRPHGRPVYFYRPLS